MIAPAAIASAFLVAELFFRLVERPAIRLSRRLDATATSRPVVG
jgi:peptidoglycan/LPS O-acetylase OafA/YrhL